MNRRPWPWLLVLLAAAFVTWWLFAPREDDIAAPPLEPAPHIVIQEKPPLPPTPPPVAPPVKPPAPPPDFPTAPPGGYTAEQRGVTVHPEASQDIERVHGMLRDYRTVYGENPVGTNAEIMAALNGGNPKQARLGPPDGQGMNAKGELVDRWGTPYFFHQLDAQLMEIHSAGADKVMGTADDVVSR